MDDNGTKPQQEAIEFLQTLAKKLEQAERRLQGAQRNLVHQGIVLASIDLVNALSDTVAEFGDIFGD